MTGGTTGEGPGNRLDAVRRELELTREELWLLYLGLGGEHSLNEMISFLAGRGGFTRLEHDVLVQALNEEFIATGGNHPVPYADTDGAQPAE